MDYFISFSGEKCLLKAWNDLVIFLRKKTSRLSFLLSIPQSVDVTLLFFSLPEKLENEHSTVTSVPNYAFCGAVVIPSWQLEARVLHLTHIYQNSCRLYFSWFFRIKIEKKYMKFLWSSVWSLLPVRSAAA